MQHFDVIDRAAAFAMATLLGICLVHQLSQWVLQYHKRRMRISPVFPTPHQDAVDALTVKRYQARLAMHPKAARAEATMAAWHRDQRSDGTRAQVIPIRGREYGRR